MLKKLRRKFIIINMAMVSVVVVAVLALICVVGYQQSRNEIFNAIRSSVAAAIEDNSSHGGGFFGSRRAFEEFFGNSSSENLFPGGRSGNPDGTFGGTLSGNESLNIIGEDSGSSPTGAESSGSTNQNSSNSETGSGLESRPPRIGGQSDSQVVPVAVYQVLSVSSFEIASRASSAALSDSTLSSAIEETWGLAEGEGTLDSLGLFYVKEVHDNYTYLGFASISSIRNYQKFVLVVVVIGLATLLVFFLISLFFSRWALRPVEEAWLKQNQFLADASHDLKTPLTVILANMDIMLKHPERSVASQAQWLESTQHEALGMQELVVSMLDLAKLDASGKEGGSAATIPMEDLNLSDVAFGSLLQFESIAFEKQVSLADDIDENIHILGNAQQLERLCGTLLDNGCKYAPAGSCITVSLKAEDASTLKGKANTHYHGDLPRGCAAILTVNNEGPAISPEDLPHVFDRFYRSDKARTHDSSNTSFGLGLAIAAGTVTAHSGCIMVTSTEGQGTSFTVALPLP